MLVLENIPSLKGMSGEGVIAGVVTLNTLLRFFT